jgi:Flp pilus assembly protein protease CpaA
LSYIDIKKEIIPDAIIIPSFIVLAGLKYFENTLEWQNVLAVGIVLVVFLIPIILNMAFGGGDLRFGAFCALFLGLKPIGLFIMLSGLLHLLITFVLKKKSFAFAPSMSVAAILALMLGSYV